MDILSEELMKISVVGMWHLGMTYSIGLAQLGHEVIGIDPNEKAIQTLASGNLLVHEPKLRELLESKLTSKDLKFSSSYEDCAESQVIFLTFDTPVNNEDSSDVDFVFRQIEKLLHYVGENTLLVICSQLPVGSCKKVSNMAQRLNKSIEVVSHPENLRIGRAFETFFDPDRLIFGTLDGNPSILLQEVFQPLNKPKFWMKIESAEMSKHALNTFLALSITFAGEIAQVCSSFGADAKEVELALKSDSRIGLSAYLTPGLGFSGGTLARDVNTVAKLQESLGRDTSILSMIMKSNEINNSWVEQNLRKVLPLKNERIVFCGVSYVQGTNTLRRSISLDVMSSLSSDGYEVCFVEDETFDSFMDFRFQNISKSNGRHIDALVVMKNLKVFETKQEYIAQIINQSTWILDPFRILEKDVKKHNEIKRYLSVGMIT